VSSDELDLGELDSEEEAIFPPAERKVFTQPYDLSVQTLIEQWETQLLILPEMQREYVWDNGRASRLVESLLLNIPIPILYFAENEDAQYEIIDGHQRIRTVVRYLSNEFALSGLRILNEYKGMRCHQLPAREQRFLRMRTLRAVVIGVDSHPTMKFEIFERLNSGSITLNAQELRNSLYRGSFNKLLRELVKNKPFREIIGSSNPRRRMVDEELLLRFFALHEKFSDYKTPLKRFLNEFMSSVKDAEPERLAEFEDLFTSTVDRVRRFIGDHAFRLTDADGKPLEKPVNRALFDCQMLAFSWVSTEATTKERTRSELALLYESSNFLDAVRRATGDRSRTRRRVREMVCALEQAGFGMTIPYDLSD